MKLMQLASPALALLISYTAAQSCRPDSTISSAANVDVDVVFIGGGSGGIHAAIQIKDAGASVLVLEKKSQIGGHAETYINPQTKRPANVGVVLFENSATVSNYFTRLNVSQVLYSPVTDLPVGTPLTLDFDLSLGIPIPPQSANASTTQTQQILSAVQNYTVNVLSKYPWLDTGYLVPDPVPGELIAPFAQFAQEHGFLPLLPIIAQYNWFTGDIATIPALYGIKGLGPTLLNNFFSKFIIAASGDTRDLYEAAASDLGSSSILLNTTIIKINRDIILNKATNLTGVSILIQQPDQPRQLICARKLVVAIPQTIENVGNYDLSRKERALFSKFSALGYWAAIVNVPGLNNSIRNVGVLDPFGQPAIPGAFNIQSSGSPGDFILGVGFNDHDYTDATAQNIIRESLKKLSARGAAPENASQTATFPKFLDHWPYNLRVSAEEIGKGFYGKLLANQGVRNAYWTGAAFAGHNSASIWNFNEGIIVPGLKKDLGL